MSRPDSEWVEPFQFLEEPPTEVRSRSRLITLLGADLVEKIERAVTAAQNPESTAERRKRYEATLEALDDLQEPFCDEMELRGELQQVVAGDVIGKLHHFIEEQLAGLPPLPKGAGRPKRPEWRDQWLFGMVWQWLKQRPRGKDELISVWRAVLVALGEKPREDMHQLVDRLLYTLPPSLR